MAAILTLARALALLQLTTILLDSVHGHGMLLDPPGRASMWRSEAGGFNNPVDYNDNGLNCGGKHNQYELQGGRCGICGDPYQGPRLHEVGERYANGIITRTYRQGQVIQATVQITVSHEGWFEFKLCPNNDPHREASQECLDRHVLPLADGSGSRLYIGTAAGVYHVTLRLPADVTCTQCVFQWRYHGGNNKEVYNCVDCNDQEEFYGCSDVRIVASSDVNSSVTNNDVINSVTTYVNSIPTYQPPTTAPVLSQPPDLPLPPLGDNEDVPSHVTPLPATATAAPRDEGTGPGTAQPAGGQGGGPLQCATARFRWPGQPLMDLWCQSFCRANGQCSQNYCIC